MATIGNLVVNMSANSGKFDRSMKKSQGLVKSFASTAVKSIGALALAYAGLSTATSAFRKAQEQIASERKLEAVLKATGHAALLTSSQIKAYASELQGMTNFTDEATINAAGLLATFKEIKGDLFKDALSAVQDMSSVMGTDMKSSVLQLGKALNDPIKGVGALTEVGVSFTEQQREQIRTLQKSGDILSAQSIILKELQSEFGGAAKAMADPWTQASNAIGDAMEEIGMAIRDVGPIMKDLSKLLGREIRSIARAIGEVSDIANKIRSIAGPVSDQAVSPLERMTGPQALRDFHKRQRERKAVEKQRRAAQQQQAKPDPLLGPGDLMAGIDMFAAKIKTAAEQVKVSMLPAWAKIERHAGKMAEQMEAVTDFRSFTGNLVADLKVATGMMTQVDRTIQDFADKGIASGPLEQLRELLNLQDGLGKSPTVNNAGSFESETDIRKIFAQSERNKTLENIQEQSKKLLEQILAKLPDNASDPVIIQGAV